MFGVELEIEAAPFVEKDKVVGRCAASAIWSVLAAHPQLSDNARPSLSAITKAALSIKEGSRTFPADSLTTRQITRCLRSFGLEATVYDIGHDDGGSYVKELTHAYVSNDIPILLGGTVYKRDGDKIDKIGDHLVCVGGYKIGQDVPANPGNIAFKASRISRLYVHDDRLGPYVGWQETEATIPDSVDTKQSSVAVWRYGLKDDKDKLIESSVEFFVPDQVVVGADHKIRISYTEIYDYCLSFRVRVDEALVILSSDIKAVEYSDEIQALENALMCKFSIRLSCCNAYKASILEVKSFISFNGVFDKNSILLRSIPKHIWLCELESEGRPFLDIIFDATEVPQGNSLVGVTVYDADADIVTRIMEELIQKRYWAGGESGDQTTINFRPFSRFYSLVPSSQLLNTRYGALRPALRRLAKGELDQTNNITKRDVITISSDGPKTVWNKILKKNLQYIWVVDAAGNLVLGEDIDSGISSADERDKQGHPTLIDGRSARLGGELFWKKGEDGKRGFWEVNLFSATYSNHLEKPSELANQYLDNVISYLLKGFGAKPNYG